MSAELKNSFSRSAPSTQHLLLLQCFVDNVRQRGVAVEDVDIEAFVFERAHRIEPFFFTRPAAAHPNLHALQLAVTLCLAESIDDASKRLLHVREVRNGAADDDVLDAGQRTDL